MSDFSLENFDELKSFAEKRRYADQNLKKLGAGSARVVYDLGNGKVLKLAFNDKGIDQNDAESGAFHNSDIAAKVTASAPDDSWIVSEFAKKLSPTRFKQLTGGVEINDLLMYLFNQRENSRGKKDIFDQDKKIKEFLDENDFVYELLAFINDNDLHYGDLSKLGAYGEVMRNGRPQVVVRDYGLTNYVYDTHYNPNRKKRMYELVDMNREDQLDNFEGISQADVMDGGYGGFALVPYTVDDPSGYVNEEEVRFVERFMKKPIGMISNIGALHEVYKKNKLGVKNGLKQATNKSIYFRNLLKLQEYLKENNYIDEDLLYWGKDTGKGDPDTFEIGVNENDELVENINLVNEDGSSLYSTLSGTSDTDIPPYFQGMVDERELKYMPNSTAVTVKKKCRLAGLGNTSVACNQGDITNLDLKSMNENTDNKKYYRAVEKNMGKTIEFEPNGYYEAIGDNGYPIMKYDTFWTSRTKETAASKTVGGAILGLYSMFINHGKDPKTFYVYEINEKPDVDISHWSYGDFAYLEEVRYRRPVKGTYKGKVDISDDMKKRFQAYYEMINSEPYDEPDEETSQIFKDTDYDQYIGGIKKMVHEKKLNKMGEGVGDTYAEKEFNMQNPHSDFETQYNKEKGIESGEEIIRGKTDEGQNITLIKNPKSVNNVDAWARGVIDDRGNLYLEQESNVIHYDLLIFLAQKGLIQYDPPNWESELPTRFITIQRLGNSNIIGLGESNSPMFPESERTRYPDFWKNIPEYEEAVPVYQKFFDLAKSKNPSFKFVNELLRFYGKNLNEEESIFNKANAEEDRLEQKEKEYMQRIVKPYADLQKKYYAPYLNDEELDLVYKSALSNSKLNDRILDRKAYDLRNKAYAALKSDNPAQSEEINAASNKYFGLWKKVSQYFMKKKMDMNSDYNMKSSLSGNPTARYGLAGDVSVSEVSHFTTTENGISIVKEGEIIEGDGNAISVTTNKNLVKDIKPVFYHPQPSGFEGVTYRNLSTQFVLDFNKIKADNIKYRVGDEFKGTHIGEEEIRLYPKDSGLDLFKYLKRVIFDPSKEKSKETQDKFIDLLKDKGISYFTKGNVKEGISTTLDEVDKHDDYKIMNGASDEAIKNNKIVGQQMLRDEASGFDNSEELLRSGGFSNDTLALAAFGFTEESVKTMMPRELNIKWKDDFQNVRWEIKKKGLTDKEWANSINLSEPIDVSFDGSHFYIEDGHHRYYAAKILSKPLNVNLEIKANPIIPLSNSGYDQFHRETFDKTKSKINEDGEGAKIYVPAHDHMAWISPDNKFIDAHGSHINTLHQIYPDMRDNYSPEIYDRAFRDGYTRIIFNKGIVGDILEIHAPTEKRLKEILSGAYPSALRGESQIFTDVGIGNNPNHINFRLPMDKDELNDFLYGNTDLNHLKFANKGTFSAFYENDDSILNEMGMLESEHVEIDEDVISEAIEDEKLREEISHSQVTVDFPSGDIPQGYGIYDIKSNGEPVGKLEVTNKKERYLYLDKIIIDKEQRGLGFASAAVKLLIKYADNHNKIITLTPDNVWGSSKEKLTQWYKSLGFVMNKGRNKDFQTQQLMYKLPKNYAQNMIAEGEILSLQKLPFKQEIQDLGGKIFSVGGAVRDEFLGKESKDLDILITGVPFEQLEQVLAKYGRVDAVGKSFGILKFKPKGATEDIDIAIPRSETATGQGGHKAFDVKSDPYLPIEKDLYRRDFTINAIAKDIDGNIIDPFNGREDLHDKVIKVVNPEAFADDPLRMLRAVQFASRFGFEIEPFTMKMIKENASKIKEIPPERVLTELDKIVKKGNALISLYVSISPFN